MGLVINITHSQGLVHEFEVHPGPITSSDRCQSAVRKWKTNLIEKVGTFHSPQQLSPKKGKPNVIGTWLSTPVVSSADEVENKADRKAGT